MSSSLESGPVSWPGHRGCQRRAEVPWPAGLSASPEQTRPEGGVLCALLVITDVAEFRKVCTIHWWEVLFPWEPRVSQEMPKNCQRKQFLERVGWSLASRRQGALPQPRRLGGSARQAPCSFPKRKLTLKLWHRFSCSYAALLHGLLQDPILKTLCGPWGVRVSSWK